jgi:hypothetical protein
MIFNFSASIILLIVLLIMVYYNTHRKEIAQSKISEIEAETNSITNKANEIRTRFFEVQKYEKSWLHLPENKKTIVKAKIDDINSLLETIGDKHLISERILKISLPENLPEGFLSTKTLLFSFATGDLSFFALSDVKAIEFISDFINAFPGYAIITKFSLEKNKSYDEQDLILISTGKTKGLIKCNLSFTWFFYKEKPTNITGKTAE